MRKDEQEARRLVRERSGGICERCAAARATNFQHRQARGQGGPWTASNGLDVCGSGTTGCHGYMHAHPAESYERGWSVHSWDDPAEVPVLTAQGWMQLNDDGSWTAVAHA
jgi:hypothetical protein